VADAPVQINLHIDRDTLTATAAVFTKMLASAVGVYNQRCAEMRGNLPEPIVPGQFLPLPAEFSNPNYVRYLRVTDDIWNEVVPGLQARASRGLNGVGFDLEFRLTPEVDGGS
jgi:hypothetical protein